MGRGLSVQGAEVAPFPLSKSARSAAALVIPNGPALADLGSVVLPGGDVSKKISVSVQVTTDGAQAVTLHLYRNGAEIDATDTFTQDIGAAGTWTINAHWYDQASIPGQATYSVQASSTAGAVTTAGNRRVTVTSTGGD